LNVASYFFESIKLGVEAISNDAGCVDNYVRRRRVAKRAANLVEVEQWALLIKDQRERDPVLRSITLQPRN
jgi:hypothetical protein